MENATQDRVRNEWARKLAPAVDRIARSLARRMPASVDVEELAGAGRVGLVRALGRFESSDDRSFEAYAIQRIRGAMIDEVRRVCGLTRTQLATVSTLENAERSLTGALGRPPESSEVAASLGWNLGKYHHRRLRSHRSSSVSFDTLGDEGLQMAMGPGGDEPRMEELLDRARLWRAAAAARRELPPRLERVLRMSFDEGMTLAAIGAQLGVTEARACQLRTEAVARLRARLLPSGAAPEAADPRKDVPRAAAPVVPLRRARRRAAELRAVA